MWQIVIIVSAMATHYVGQFETKADCDAAIVASQKGLRGMQAECQFIPVPETGPKFTVPKP